MTSVERIQEYHNLSEEDGNAKSMIKPPPFAWPREGVITFTNLSFAYFKDGPLVLKDVNLQIHSIEKVIWLIFSIFKRGMNS